MALAVTTALATAPSSPPRSPRFLLGLPSVAAVGLGLVFALLVSLCGMAQAALLFRLTLCLCCDVKHSDSIRCCTPT